jgi:hypothetical protein
MSLTGTVLEIFSTSSRRGLMTRDAGENRYRYTSSARTPKSSIRNPEGLNRYGTLRKENLAWSVGYDPPDYTSFGD